MNKYIKTSVSLEEILSQENPKKNTVMYIHVPFCSKICSFCNMRRSLSKVYEDYDKFLIKHINMIGNTIYGKTTTIDSVYFGGGTPTTMNEKQLAGVLNAIYDNFHINKNAEISMETTLTELTPEKLKYLKNYGLNRISVGVQTFSDKGRILLNRTGNGKFAKERILNYLDTGFKNVNIDLIFNYPYQTEDELREDMNIIGELDLAGYSMYSLILDNNSQLAKKVNQAAIKVKNDLKHDRYFHNIVVEEGEKHGYEFFEFTKMVKPDRDKYKYIKNRNTGEDTIPIGAGAGGEIMGAVGMNPIDIKKYIDSINNFKNIQLIQFSKDYEIIQKATKAVQFGKIDLSLVPAHLQDVAEKFLNQLVVEGMLIKDDKTFILTKDGKYWGNNINKEYTELLINNDYNYK